MLLLQFLPKPRKRRRPPKMGFGFLARHQRRRSRQQLDLFLQKRSSGDQRFVMKPGLLAQRLKGAPEIFVMCSRARLRVATGLKRVRLAPSPFFIFGEGHAATLLRRASRSIRASIATMGTFQVPSTLNAPANFPLRNSLPISSVRICSLSAAAVAVIYCATSVVISGGLLS